MVSFSFDDCWLVCSYVKLPGFQLFNGLYFYTNDFFLDAIQQIEESEEIIEFVDENPEQTAEIFDSHVTIGTPIVKPISGQIQVQEAFDYPHNQLRRDTVYCSGDLPRLACTLMFSCGGGKVSSRVADMTYNVEQVYRPQNEGSGRLYQDDSINVPRTFRQAVQANTAHRNREKENLKYFEDQLTTHVQMQLLKVRRQHQFVAQFVEFRDAYNWLTSRGELRGFSSLIQQKLSELLPLLSQKLVQDIFDVDLLDWFIDALLHLKRLQSPRAARAVKMLSQWIRVQNGESIVQQSQLEDDDQSQRSGGGRHVWTQGQRTQSQGQLDQSYTLE